MHFYMMSLGAGEYIDAALRGNAMRFLNHSCSSNVQTEVWQVGPEERVGVFATADIPAGTELTLDYQWQRVGHNRVPCRCGAPNCRAFLGATEEGLQASVPPAVPPGPFVAPTAAVKQAGHGLDDCFLQVWLPLAAAEAYQAGSNRRECLLPGLQDMTPAGATWAALASAATPPPPAPQGAPHEGFHAGGGGMGGWFLGKVLAFDEVAGTHRVQVLASQRWVTLHLQGGVSPSTAATDATWPWLLLDSPAAAVRVAATAPVTSAADEPAPADLATPAGEEAGSGPAGEGQSATHQAVGSASALQAWSGGSRSLDAAALADSAVRMSEWHASQAAQAAQAAEQAQEERLRAEVAAQALQQRLHMSASALDGEGDVTIGGGYSSRDAFAAYAQQQAAEQAAAAADAAVAAQEAEAAAAAARKRKREQRRQEKKQEASQRKADRKVMKAAARAARKAGAGAVRSATLTAVGSKSKPKFRPAPGTLIPLPVSVEDLEANEGRLPDIMADHNEDAAMPAFGLSAPFVPSWRMTLAEAVNSTPARASGLGPAEEQRLRRACIALTIRAGAAARAPLPLLLHAAVLVVRGTSLRSPAGLQPRATAAAALHFAGAASHQHALGKAAAAWHAVRAALRASTPEGQWGPLWECAVEATTPVSPGQAVQSAVHFAAEVGRVSTAQQALSLALRLDTGCADLSHLLVTGLASAVDRPALQSALQSATEASALKHMAAAALLMLEGQGGIAAAVASSLGGQAVDSVSALLGVPLPAGAKQAYTVAAKSGDWAPLASFVQEVANADAWAGGLQLGVFEAILSMAVHVCGLADLAVAPHNFMLHTPPAWAVGVAYCTLAHLQSMAGLAQDSLPWTAPFPSEPQFMWLAPVGGMPPATALYPCTNKRAAAAATSAARKAARSPQCVAVKAPAKPDRVGGLSKAREALASAPQRVDVLDAAWAAATIAATFMRTDGLPGGSSPNLGVSAVTLAVAAPGGSSDLLAQPPQEWGVEPGALPTAPALAAAARRMLEEALGGEEPDGDPFAQALEAACQRPGLPRSDDGQAQTFLTRAADPLAAPRTAREFHFLDQLAPGWFVARDLRFGHSTLLGDAPGSSAAPARSRLVLLQQLPRSPAPAQATESVADADSAAAEPDQLLEAASPPGGMPRLSDSEAAATTIMGDQAAAFAQLKAAHGFLGEMVKGDAAPQMAAHPLQTASMTAPSAKRPRGEGEVGSPQWAVPPGASLRDASSEGVTAIAGCGVGTVPALRRNPHVSAPLELVLGRGLVEAVGGHGPGSGVQAPPPSLQAFFAAPQSQGGAAGQLIAGLGQAELQEDSYLVYEYSAHTLAGLAAARVHLSLGQLQRVGYQLLRGVVRLHQQGLLFGCLSPDAVGLTRDGLVKALPPQGMLWDWDVKTQQGLMKEVAGGATRAGRDALSRLPEPGQGVQPDLLPPHALQCLAPELLLGCSMPFPSSDAWSVGCTLAAMALGRPLFPGNTAQEVLESISVLVGPVLKRWPAAKYLPLSKLASVAHQARTAAKASAPSGALPRLEETLRSAGMPKALVKLLRELLNLDPTARPDARSALAGAFFKEFVPLAQPALARWEGDVGTHIAGTVLLPGSRSESLITPTTFRASLPYSKAEFPDVPPHNEGGEVPPDAPPVALAGAEGVPKGVGDVDPFPYLRPCLLNRGDPLAVAAARSAEAAAAALPTAQSGSGGAAAAAVTDAPFVAFSAFRG